MSNLRRLVPIVVLALLVTACADETPGAGDTGATGPTATGATGPTAESPSPTGEPTESPTEEPAPELEDGRHFGYVQSVDVDGSALEFDLAEFYTGDEANEIAAERGDEVPVPNDYYIVNDNPRLRTLTLSRDLEIDLLDWNRCCDETFSLSLGDFADAIASADPTEIDGHLTYGAASQYWLTVDEGQVTRIEEQYLP
ncbi:MAG TPA: hypothetical protein VLA90_00685 [Actinomycetota bacterium]|nr:hypothetical protein [Actinomycetota bacterium]